MYPATRQKPGPAEVGTLCSCPWARILRVTRAGPVLGLEAATKWGQVTVNGHNGHLRREVDQTKVPPLSKIPPISVPLMFTCMMAGSLAGCLSTAAAAARHSAELAVSAE
jgi:hypothetical protein